MERAEKLALLAVAKAVQAAKRPGYDDAALVASLSELRNTLESLASDLLSKINSKADEHDHAEFARGSDVARQLESLAASLSEALREVEATQRKALADQAVGLEAAIATKAQGEHEHPEHAQLAAAIESLAASLEATIGRASETLAAEDARIRKDLLDALAQAEDQRIAADLDSALRIDRAESELDELAQALNEKAQSDHAHADLSRADLALSGRINALAEAKADRMHGHDDLESSVAMLRRVVAGKADVEHGEHLSAERVRAMVRQAKPKDGEHGQSINPRTDWKPRTLAKKLDLVRWMRGSWLAAEDTESIPAKKNPAWVLVAKDGLDGDSYISGGGMRFDDYAQSEHLEEAAGDGTVQTFTFASPVQFIVAEMVSTLDEDTQAAQIDAQEGRVIAGGEAPTTTKGAIMKHEQPVTLLVTTDTVKILTVSNARFNVYGMRRSAV